MNRRKLITLLGGAAAAWPVVARGQSKNVRRVAIATAYSDGQTDSRVQAFQVALARHGWRDASNVLFIHRSFSVDPALRRTQSAELIRELPDVILASTVPVTAALKAQTSKIPIVFAGGGDPVAAGLVESLSHPGGNVTGFPITEPSLAGKWLSVLLEAVPATRKVAVLHAPENPVRVQYVRALEEANSRFGMEVFELEARDEQWIASALGRIGKDSNSALLVLPGASTSLHRRTIIAAAAQHQLPAIYPFRIFAVDGGLVAYGASYVELFRQAASYVDRVLRGESPSSLPIQMPTKFELALNLKTARALGLTVPPTMLTRADEVIE